jgi:hypothetical protein
LGTPFKIAANLINNFELQDQNFKINPIWVFVLMIS